MELPFLVPTLSLVALAGAAYGLVHRRRHRLESAELLTQSVQALMRAMMAVHPETAEHSARVAEISQKIGRRLRLHPDQLDLLQMGSLLHDVGKLGVPAAILDKPGRLTGEEFRAVQAHVCAGVEILAVFADPRIDAVRDIVRHHHERLDGSGYPDGRRGEQISPLARIVAVADVYDALTSVRSYRGRMAHVEAMAVLWQEAAAGRLDEPAVRLLDQLPLPICRPVGPEAASEAV